MDNTKLEEWESSRNLGDELLQSVKEMKASKAGRTHKVEISTAAEARIKTGLSQAAFANLIGVSKGTLQGWEQGRRKPSGAAKTLLEIASKFPDVMRELRA